VIGVPTKNYNFILLLPSYTLLGVCRGRTDEGLIGAICQAMF